MIKIENIFIAIYGIITVFVFIIMLTYGGLFDSLHTLFFREISFIISPYSLHGQITIPLFRLYNVNFFLFSVLLFIRFRNVFAKMGALYLAMSAMTSLLIIQVPMDPIYLSHSLKGFEHILITVMAASYIIIGLGLFSYSLKKNKNLGVISKVSYAVSLIMLIAGLITTLFAIYSMPQYVGLIQKLPIFAFLLWILMTGYTLLFSDRRIHYAIPVENNHKKKPLKNPNYARSPLYNRTIKRYKQLKPRG